MTAAILSTGSELVLGQRVDTNSAWLSEFLSSMGIMVAAHERRGDDLERLVELISESWARYDVILMTGGLGPTEDDLTRLAVARAFKAPLRFRADLAKGIKALFEKREYSFTSNQLRQAWLPEGTALIENNLGTAPAFAVETPDRLMVMMPGVPQEMKGLTKGFVKEKLKSKFPDLLGVVRTTTLLVANVGEGVVDSRLSDLLSESVNPKLGLLAGQHLTRVLITSSGRTEEECEKLEAPVAEEVKRRFGDSFVGTSDPADEAAKLIISKGKRLGFADGATIGLAASPFAKKLPAGALAGSLILDGERMERGIDFLFGSLDCDLVVAIKAEPANWPRDAEQLSLSATIEIVERDSSGKRRAAAHESRASGPSDLVLARISNLAAYLLWRRLADDKR